MKILPVNLNKITIVNNKSNILNPYNFRLSKALNSDTVSFSRDLEQADESIKRIETAVDFGKGLAALYKENPSVSLNKVQNVARRYSPKINVDNIANLSKRAGVPEHLIISNAAEMDLYNKDGSLKSATLFLIKPDGRYAQDDIGYAVHEFTHALQDVDGAKIKLARETAGEDFSDAKTLHDLGVTTFKALERVISGEFSKRVDSSMLQKPPSEVTKEDIYKIYGLKNKSEFNKMVRLTFSEIFDFQCDEGPDVMKNNILGDNPLLLRRFLRKQCANLANCEREAYTAQRQIFEYMNEPCGIYSLVPVLYEAISEALL